MLKPLVKWAGGKRQIMNTLINNFPREFNDYHEPFVGAGSVFMELYNRNMLTNKHVYISDIMEPLMILYEVVKSNHVELINNLSDEDIYKNEKRNYLILRSEFNILKKRTNKNIDDMIKLSALFIYLNKIGYNGMYRENSNGDFNIPFGKQTSLFTSGKLLESAIQSLHVFLSNDLVNIECCSYETKFEHVKFGDFVYMDPPFYNTFTNYNKSNFDKIDQIRLRDYFLALSNKGCKVALSNSNEDFIKELYKDIPNVRFIEIPVKRYINSKASLRNETKKECLIVNYQI